MRTLLDLIWNNPAEAILAATLIPTALSAYYQAVAARLAQAELERRVTDIADLSQELVSVTARLDSEAQERAQLAAKHETAVVQQMNDYAAALNHSSVLVQPVWDGIRGTGWLAQHRIENLALALRALTAQLRLSTEIDPSVSAAVIQFCETTVALTKVERAEQSKWDARIKAWSADFERAKDGTYNDNVDRKAALDRELGRQDEIIRRLHEELVVALKEPQKDYRNAVSELAVLCGDRSFRATPSD